jgi:hypothetical protein
MQRVCELEVGPATLSVFETEGAQNLEAGKKLEDYFEPRSGYAYAALSVPGRSDETALVVTFPPPQQSSRYRYRFRRSNI